MFILSEIYKSIMNNRKNKVNAPQFIYSIIHKNKKIETINLPKHDTVSFNGFYIDSHLPQNILTTLNSISDIEIRATCEGYNEDIPTYLIFRLKDNDKTTKFVDYIQSKYKNVIIGSGIGNNQLYRIGITSKTWYGHPGYLEFWNSLPKIIFDALTKIK